MSNVKNYTDPDKHKIESATLGNIINSMPDAIYIGDFSGIKKCNQLALDMLGFNTLTEMNQNIDVIAEKINTRNVETEERQKVEDEVFYKALNGESTVQDVMVNNLKTKKDIYIRSTGAPVIIDGVIVGAITINTDITEYVKAKKKTDEIMEDLKKKNEALDKFVYITSHDLKAPLSSIGPLLDMIKEEYSNKILNEEGIQLLEMARKKVFQMDELIHSLLATAMSERKVKERIDLNNLLNEIIKATNVPEHIHIYKDNNLPIVSYHKVSLIQVVQNILSNAIKFIDKVPGLIHFKCIEDENQFVISISDNGPGIKKEDYTRIFEKFNISYQNPSKESSGIGLSIAKEIIEENGGKIWVESTPGEGSTFSFSIIKK